VDHELTPMRSSLNKWLALEIKFITFLSDVASLVWGKIDVELRIITSNLIFKSNFLKVKSK
jgi:hypothetical protein